ncbi:uncharacterized protein BO95DRAFT_518865 [Aspergillus brunneoviolaceus CBS 621.78]|uniref:Uncharacterized protein n=1 Tax=Aspergillus brunneoviolaceus CBS 621.78 TaxID=1450534 RepID=A0ACD1FTA5_9EURO|nr:hypothetical protein BO95DRAFT_518865 [Aspergillus brunneoviolaceus CBS 621.78]RAH40243.1 hypothetical protein BO95DRAFT_518865 [Aspergillus brunneoviolaceus CBS 621.78]
MDLTDPAHNLGTFRTRPRTSRSGDQELPWKLIIPGGEDDAHAHAHEQQQHNTSTPTSTPILKLPIQATTTTTTTTGFHPESTETWSARITGEVLRSIGKNSILVPPRPSLQQQQQQQQQRSRSAPAPEQEADSISPKSKRLSPVVGHGQGQGVTTWRTTTIPLLTPSPHPHSSSPGPGLNPGPGQGRPLLRRRGSTTDTNTNTDTIGGGSGDGGGGRTPSPLLLPPPPPCTKVDLPALPGSSESLMSGRGSQGLQEQQHPEQPSPSTEVAKPAETPSERAGKHEDDEAEIVMFSTAYPGQEWKPAGFMEASGWGYD